MSINLEEAMERVAAMQTEAMAALSPTVDATAKPFFFYVQGTFPYFINRISEWSSDGDGEEYDLDTYTIIMRCVIAHITAGYEGENETRLSEWIPHIKLWFNQRELLQSASYPDAMLDLHRARCGDGTGLQVIRHTGATETLQVCTEWTLTLTTQENIEQQYL